MRPVLKFANVVRTEMPAKKKLRLEGDEFMSFRASLPFVSQSAIAQVLVLASKEKMPDIKT